MTHLDSTHLHASAAVKGLLGFVTYRRYHHLGDDIIWRARQSRKGLLKRLHGLETPPWQRPAYNALIGALFALGSLLFIAGCGLSLIPNGLDPAQIASVFFIGSVPFTTAAFLQNLQAANAVDEFLPDASSQQRFAVIGWRPDKLGWLSAFTQFVGTVAFNFNTFDAIAPSQTWYMQDLTIWLPGIIGSVLFLVSGYLAFAEVSHGAWSWDPRDLDWQIVFINLVGCVAFMIAGVLAFVPSGAEPAVIANLANLLTMLGAVCFLISALLLIAESRKQG